MATILYVAGYGRSGSTVLSAILGAHPRIVAVGEAGFAPEEWLDPARRCSCQCSYAACQLWGPVVDAWRDRGEDLARIRAVDRLTWPARSPDPKTSALYKRYQSDLFGQAARGAGASVVVDSSKSARLTARRPLALAAIAGHDVRVIHLIRDGRATLDSLVRTGSNWVMEGHRRAYRFPASRAAIGWSWTNLYASRLRRELGSDRYLRMRFEDFMANPRAGVARICAFAGVDEKPLVDHLDRGAGFEVGHMIGGNRLRFSGTVRLREARGEQERAPLGLRHRAIFGAIGGVLNRSYGYAGIHRP